MSTPNSVTFHRVLRAPPLRVYAAFIDPRAKCKWLPPHGFVGEFQHFEARVGSGYHMTFTNLGTGHTHGFTGTFTELTPGERLCYTDRFDDPSMPGEMRITVTLRKVLCGTEIHIVQEDLPPEIPLEFCYLGWQESLSLLAQLVEAEVQ